MEKYLVVTWYHFHRRSDSLAKALGCESLFINITRKSKFKWKYLIWLNYLYRILATYFFLITKKPDIIVAVSPPSLCPIFIYFYAKIFGKKLIIDAHNGAFMNPWIKIPSYLHILKKASLVLVHNDEFENYLISKYRGVNFFTLPDKLPDFGLSLKLNNSHEEKYFFVILSFASDEPVIEIFNALKEYLVQKDKKIGFFISGNFDIDIYNTFSIVPGIKFLGYVNNDEYVVLLKNAFGVISLSTREMVQQCAVVEAISAEVPLICSDNLTNRRILSGGAIFTKNDRQDICKSIIDFLGKRYLLHQEILEVKRKWESDWQGKFSQLKHLVNFNT